MPQIGYSESGNGLVLGRRILLCAALLFLLFARSTPPKFPRMSFRQPAMQCDPHHEQRPCFDHETFEWGIATSAPLWPPLRLESFHTAPAKDPLLVFHEEGFHYNRPPPISYS
jgi:hypothetical protein